MTIANTSCNYVGTFGSLAVCNEIYHTGKICSLLLSNEFLHLLVLLRWWYISVSVSVSVCARARVCTCVYVCVSKFIHASILVLVSILLSRSPYIDCYYGISLYGDLHAVAYRLYLVHNYGCQISSIERFQVTIEYIEIAVNNECFTKLGQHHMVQCTNYKYFFLRFRMCSIPWYLVFQCHR